MNLMIIGIVLLTFFFFFDHVQILKVNCHRRKRVIQVRNLFLEFEVSFIFCLMSIIFSLLAY